MNFSERAEILRAAADVVADEKYNVYFFLTRPDSRGEKVAQAVLGDAPISLGLIRAVMANSVSDTMQIVLDGLDTQTELGSKGVHLIQRFFLAQALFGLAGGEAQEHARNMTRETLEDFRERMVWKDGVADLMHNDFGSKIQFVLGTHDGKDTLTLMVSDRDGKQTELLKIAGPSKLTMKLVSGPLLFEFIQQLISLIVDLNLENDGEARIG